MIIKRIMRQISLILMASMLHLCWLTSYGWAEITATDSVIAVSMQISADREKIRALLNREDVQHQLETYGISHEEALARVNSLTDEEIGALVKEIGDVPAGGNVLAVVVYGLYLAGLLVAYLITVLFRGIECIFSDCEAKGGASYVFGGFGEDENSQSIENEEGEDDCDPGMESCI